MPIDQPIIYSEDKLAAAWLGRVNKADKYYESWSNKFDCDTLEEYYYGFQWKDGSPDSKYRRYVINMIFATLEVKKPSLLFQNPLFRVKAKPARGEWDFTASSQRAMNREDALNTIISDPEQEFNEEFEAFVVDAFFRFGVMEVGYSANWIENPNAGKPILKSDNNPYYDPDGEDGKDNIIREPDELPDEEKVYFKRIPPWRFRVGGTDGRTFKKCSWVGYYDWFRVEDLKANKKLKNLDKLEYAGARSEDFTPSQYDTLSEEQADLAKTGDLCKCWVIYDLRAKKKYIFASSQAVTLLEKKYKEFPLVSLKFVEKLRGWYPVPLVFNWKGPQDEINHAREQQRIHRMRAARRYLYEEGMFKGDEELDQLENGPDMTFVPTQGKPGDRMQALEMAPLDSAVAQSLIVSKDDLNIVSGTSGEQRLQADRTTATQANIVDMKAQLRETAARTKIANTLKSIGRLALITMQEHFSLEFWVKVRTDRDNENFMGEFQEASEEWRQMTSSEFGNELDFEVDISLDTISPIENQASKAAFIEFLSVLTNFPQIAFDPVLVREAAYRCNYRNEKVISRMAKMAQVAMLGQIEQAKGALAQMAMESETNAVQTRVQQMTPPDQATIQTQLAGQTGAPAIQ
jgi:hypothetical protein